jgi:hypothetical protein
MDIQSLTVQDSGMNNGNAGGTYPFIFVVKHADVNGLTTTANPSNPDDIPVINYAGLSGLTGLKKIEITEQTGKVTDELIGDTDGKSFSSTLEFHVPGSSAKNLGFAAASKNARLVFIVPEENGTLRVVGNLVNPARFESFSADTGASREDRKGGTYTFKTFGNTPAPILTNATVDTLLAIAPSGSGA